jgi:hypothetical protein
MGTTADEIRVFAKRHHVDPARAAGEHQVMIRSENALIVLGCVRL